MIIIMTICATIAGLAFAIQAPINSNLSVRTNAFWSTAISFFGGTLITGLIVLLFGDGNLSNLTHIESWKMIGGAYGAGSVVITSAVIPVLGVALSLTIIMFGQIITGACIDYFGLFGTTPTELSVLRFFGIAAVATGIIIIYLGNKQKNSRIGIKEIVFGVLALFGGVLGAIQSPTNAALAGSIGNWEGTFISFAVGLLIILIVALISTKGRVIPFRGVGIRPWMTTGGAFGVIGIFFSLFTVTTLGSALQIACTMVGQIGGGILVDSLGIIGTPKVKIDRSRLLGMLMIFLGVVLVNLA